MKKLFCFVGLLYLCLLAANPIDPAIIQQIYFDADDDLILQFGEQADFLAGSEVTINCGEHILQFTLPEGTYPQELNLSQLLPEMELSRASGNLSLESANVNMQEAVSWGDSPDCDVSALQGSQSIYQYHQHVYWEWEDFTVKSWAKSPNPASVEHYHCQAGLDLSLGVRNQQYEPLANIPIYYQDYSSLIGYTDQFGSFSMLLPARRTRIRVYHPQDPDTPVFDQSFMGEPYGMNMFTVVMDYTSVDDPYESITPARLILKPSVIHPGESIYVEYAKEPGKDMRLGLYDIKGRLIREYDYLGPQSWLHPDLSSGMYFLRLRQGDRVLDTRKFILLK